MGGERATPPTQRTRPTAVREPTTGDAPRHLVGARRRLARLRRTGGSAPCWVTHTVVGNGTAASIGGKFPALAGRTGQAAPDPYMAVAAIRGAPLPDRGCFAVPLSGRGAASPARATRRGHPRHTPARGDRLEWHTGRTATGWFAGPGGPAGQAPPDPYRAGRSPPAVAPMCPTGNAPRRVCRGGAPPRPPALWARQSVAMPAPVRGWPGRCGLPTLRAGGSGSA